MSKKFWLAAVALLATGLIAAGCGDDDEEAATSDAPATEESSEATSESEGSSSSEGSTAADVQAACEDAIAGTPGEEAGQPACEAAADAFEQCAAQAEDVPDESGARETAIQACQDAADQAVAALEGATP